MTASDVPEVTAAVAPQTELEDVKPRIRPFPLDVDVSDTARESPAKSCASDSQARTNSSTLSVSKTPPVKKEPSPLEVKLVARSVSPIYVSSDSDSEEVDAQMAEEKAQHEEEDEGANANASEKQDATPETGGAGNEDKEDEEEGQKDDSVGEQPESPALQTSSLAHKFSLPPRASSSSVSPSPFRSFARTKPRPQPKPMSPTLSPVNSKKRPFISASQPVQSSRQSVGRPSVAAEPHASGQVPKLPAQDGSDDEQGRYAKRAKTTASSTGPSRNKDLKRRTRHPKYWLLDGSVVVQIGDVMFRLHRSRLVQQSTYFAQLFSKGLRHNEDDGDSDVEQTDTFDFVDECPVYQLRNVLIEDFEELLVALDNAM